MKCPKCDREVKDGTKFCPGCGAEIAAGKPAKKATPPAKQKSQLKKSEYLEKKQARRAKTVARQLWTIFAVIIVCAAAFYFLFMGINSYMIEKRYKTCELNRRTGNYEEGIENCKYVVGKNPRHKKAWLELARCHMGTDLVLGDEAYERVVEVTGNALDWVETGGIYAERGRALYFLGNIERASQSLHTAIELEPGNRLANQYLGYIYSEHGKRRKAIEHLERSLEDASRVEQKEINEEIGDLHYRSGDFSDAIDSYLAVMEIDVNDINTCIKLAKSYVGDRQLGEAMKEAKRCSQIAPENKTAENLKQKIQSYKNRLDVIFYISERKSADEMFVLLYNAFLSHIEKINDDPDAFIGQDDLALEEMIRDAKSLYNNYSSLKAPAEYYHIHSYTLTATTTLIDTMNQLKKYLTRAEPQTMRSLTRQLDTLNRTYAQLREMWDNEARQLNMEDLMAEAKKLREATGTQAIPFPIEAEKPEDATQPAEMPQSPPGGEKDENGNDM